MRSDDTGSLSNLLFYLVCSVVAVLHPHPVQLTLSAGRPCNANSPESCDLIKGSLLRFLDLLVRLLPCKDLLRECLGPSCCQHFVSATACATAITTITTITTTTSATATTMAYLLPAVFPAIFPLGFSALVGRGQASQPSYSFILHGLNNQMTLGGSGAIRKEI